MVLKCIQKNFKNLILNNNVIIEGIKKGISREHAC